jgi:hypothetical protein
MLLQEMDRFDCWPSTPVSGGDRQRHLPGTRDGSDLLERLDKLWVFIRLRLQHHFAKQSGRCLADGARNGAGGWRGGHAHRPLSCWQVLERIV